jgi:tetraacyldisaccharide 4'-kinase
MYLCERMQALGRAPVVLTRGYGGRIRGPHLVAQADTARDVGDEPLLLARHARVVVSRDRADGARRIEAMADAGVIVMDDGLQNPELAKDLVIAVVDGARAFGNGRVIPAGPLRAPLAFQLELADIIVVNAAAASGGEDIAAKLKDTFNGPVLRCATVPAGDLSWLAGQRVVAWAGIGAPERFFAMLAALDAGIIERITFPDHHVLTTKDAQRLLQTAQHQQAVLVTTEKDLARLSGTSGARRDLATASRPLPIRIVFADPDAERFDTLIQGAVQNTR